MKDIAVIGAGAWGRNLVRTLYVSGHLGAVIEASEALRTSIPVDFPGIEVMQDYGEIFGREDIRAVAIATPAPTHHRIAKACLIAGKDVFVEKPMTLTEGEAQDLVDTALQYGRILMAGHLLLYKPAVQFIRDFLNEGKLGRVFTYHQERMKLGKARSVENALWSLGVHDVAALLYIAGDSPVSVTASGHRGLQAGIEDDVYLHLAFQDGRVAHLHNSWLWPEDRRGLRVIGEQGMLVYDEKTEVVKHVKKRITGQLLNVDEGEDIVFESPAGFQALACEMEHFAECCRTRQSPRSCGKNGLEVVRVLEQAAL